MHKLSTPPPPAPPVRHSPAPSEINHGTGSRIFSGAPPPARPRLLFKAHSPIRRPEPPTPSLRGLSTHASQRRSRNRRTTFGFFHHHHHPRHRCQHCCRRRRKPCPTPQQVNPSLDSSVGVILSPPLETTQSTRRAIPRQFSPRVKTGKCWPCRAQQRHRRWWSEIITPPRTPSISGSSSTKNTDKPRPRIQYGGGGFRP